MVCSSEYMKTKDIVISGFFALQIASFMLEKMGIGYEISEMLIRVDRLKMVSEVA